MAGQLPINEKLIAGLRLEEDGSLSNKRVERYALLRAEEVVSPTAAWTICMTTKGGNLPSGSYQANIHKHRAFKARLEALMAEKARLTEDGGVWGQLEWQSRQIYRRAAALDDIGKMQAATETLLRIALRNDPKPAKPPKEEGDDDAQPRGRGAPPVPAPDPVDSEPDYLASRLLDK